VQELDFYNRTTLHPLGLTALVVLALYTLGARRERLLLGFLVLATFVAPAQRLVIGGLDFTLFRLLVMVGLLRILARGELGQVRLTRLDAYVIAWTLVSAAAYVALHGSVSAAINRAGRAVDYIGFYLVARTALRQPRDLQRIVQRVALLALPIALFFLVERTTARNPFYFLGGVPEITVVRDGRLRCQGPFPHPILAGWFWVSWLPLFVALLWTHPRLRMRAIAAACAVVVIAVTNASSTPIGGLLAVAIGLSFFPLRTGLPALRLGVLVALPILHLVMKQPVWHLVARIDLAGGSTGYHRFNLIDQAIRRFPEWALVGVESTKHWGLDLWDTANQFVEEGVRGGAVSLLLFVLTLVRAFGDIGRALCASRRQRDLQRWCYALGVVLFAQCMMFLAISISYSQQAMLMMLLTLAATQALRQPARAATPGPGIGVDTDQRHAHALALAAAKVSARSA
jgi:hypothetical protein